MVSKSFTQLPTCLIITFIVTCIFCTAIASQKSYREMEILDDLPLKNNTGKYLTKLEKILQFVKTHRRYMNMNLGFGLFLVTVNLRTVLEVRGSKIPNHIAYRLDELLKTNDNLMKYFRTMLSRNIRSNDDYSSARKIADLFCDGEINWLNHLQMFRTNLLKKTTFYSKRTLNEIYSKWPQYVEKVYNFESYFPSPKLSDECISSLADIPVNFKMQWSHCNVSNSCIQLARNGTDYGYGITHRLLYLLMARFSRGCTVISASEDKYQIDELCAKIYNEAEYHAHNDFKLPDLSMEQICLCTLEGHVQFLRRSWIDDLLDFQNKFGCVASSVEGREIKSPVDTYKAERASWQIIDGDQDIMGGSCNTHTTGVAAAVLSSAIRFIIEKFS